MKIVLLNTSFNKGGAAIACYRLLKALISKKENAVMLVQQDSPKDECIVSTSNSYFKKKLNFLRFITERLVFLLYEKSKEIRFAFSLANTGESIINNQKLIESDIVHLHWINQGFLSIKDIKTLKKLNKPIVWTLHDMWAFTGGCHYSNSCKNYLQTCGNCLFLRKPHSKDLSFKIFNKKRNLYSQLSIHFVTCSSWLGSIAKESALLKNLDISVIPNPIDVNLYKPINKGDYEKRKSFNLPIDKKLILFGAANINDKRKGIEYLINALKILQNNSNTLLNDLNLVIFGKSTDNYNEIAGFKVHNLSILTSQQRIADLYACVDLFVLPSLEDNLPNTVMESLACGTPVVAFNNGGIPDMVEHKVNGYLASYKSSSDLAIGIEWVLMHNESENLSKNARNKVLNYFTEEIVANQYIALYRELLSLPKATNN